jgi:hypothetical protein
MATYVVVLGGNMLDSELADALCDADARGRIPLRASLAGRARIVEYPAIQKWPTRDYQWRMPPIQRDERIEFFTWGVDGASMLTPWHSTKEVAIMPRLPHVAFGDHLRSWREARGLTVAQLAVHLKLHPRQVEALERDELVEMHDQVEARCRELQRAHNEPERPTVQQVRELWK